MELLKDRYKIIRKIGKGGMAEIYLAMERGTNEYVAIKILHPDKKDSYADKKRFLEEIKLTKKVDSPYVVKVFDWAWDDNIQYIVMEYIDGVTLKEYVQSKTKLTIDEAVDFSKQLALGFDAIHKAGIVHRDIKATNIVVSGHGQVKIIDFGIAITDESERLTRTDNIIASPQYIAPEIVNLGTATNQSDIYSLGILIYEMLTGSVPFNGADAYQTVMMHKQKTVPQVNKIFNNIPQALANVVIKATAKKNEKRYSSMYFLYKDLATCLDNSRLYEEPLNLSEKPKKTFSQMVNSKWTLMGIIITFVIILIIIIITLSIKVF